MKSLIWVKEKTPYDDFSPSPRAGHSLTYVPDIKALLLFGGIHNSARTNELYLYDIDKNTWRLQPTTGRHPSERSYHSAFYEDSWFFLYGGQGENSKSMSDFHFLSIKSWEWKLLFILDSPPPRHFASLCNMNNPEKEKIIFGGVTAPEGKLLNDVYVVNYTNVSFSSFLPKIPGAVCTLKRCKGEVPAPRKGHCATVYKKSLIIYGGTTDNPDDANFVYQLCFENWTWKKVTGARPLSARTFASYCFFDKSVLLMFGGIDNQTGKHLNDIISLDLNEFKWSSPFVAGHLPMPRVHHASCLYDTPYNGDVVAVIGGLEASYCNMGLFKLVEKESKNNGDLRQTKELNMSMMSRKEVYVPNAVRKDSNASVSSVRRDSNASSLASVRKDSITSNSVYIQYKGHIDDLESSVDRERAHTADLEDEIAKLENEIKHLQEGSKREMRKLREEIGALDDEYTGNYEATKDLFSMIPIEQLIFKKINTKDGLLEDQVQRTESYLIALDKLYLAISRYHTDHRDEHLIRLKKTYEASQDEILQLRDEHKESLWLMRCVYDEHGNLNNKLEAEIENQRNLILDIDKKFSEILVHKDLEDD